MSDLCGDKFACYSCEEPAGHDGLHRAGWNLWNEQRKRDFAEKWSTTGPFVDWQARALAAEEALATVTREREAQLERVAVAAERFHEAFESDAFISKCDDRTYAAYSTMRDTLAALKDSP